VFASLRTIYIYPVWQKKTRLGCMTARHFLLTVSNFDYPVKKSQLLWLARGIFFTSAWHSFPQKLNPEPEKCCRTVPEPSKSARGSFARAVANFVRVVLLICIGKRKVGRRARPRRSPPLPIVPYAWRELAVHVRQVTALRARWRGQSKDEQARRVSVWACQRLPRMP